MGFDAVKKPQKHVFFFSHTFWGSLHCKSSSFFYVLYDQEQHRTHHSPFTSSCGERLPLFFITGQLFKAKLDEYLRNRLRKGDASRQIPMVARFFGKTWVLNGFFYLMFDHPHFRSIDVGKIGFIAATSPKIGVTWLLECWMTGVPSLFRTIRSYYFSSGAMEPWNAGPCRVDDRSPKCLKSILSLFLKILGQNSPAYLFFWQQS